MKVILLQEVEKLGAEGAVVLVKDGYGRNFLIPRGLAKLATAGAVKAWTEERKQAGRKLAQRKEDAQNLAAELAKMDVALSAKVGEENRIFGTITAQQIVDALAHEGVTVDRRKVELTEEIRHLGVYTALVKLHPEVTAEFKFRVEGEGIVKSAEEVPASVEEVPASVEEVPASVEEVPASDDSDLDSDEE